MKTESESSKEATAISHVEPLHVDVARPSSGDMPQPLTPMDVEPVRLTVWESLTLTIDELLMKMKLATALLPYVYKFIEGLIMNNWKTTLGAIIGGLATVLNVLGIVNISTEVQLALVTLGLFVTGIFAKDANSSKKSTEVKAQP